MNYLEAFPDYDDELCVPKGWSDSSSPEDPCPSIIDKNKIVKIFQDYKEPEHRKDYGRFFPRFCAIVVNPSYQSNKFTDQIGLSNLDDFKSVLHFSQSFLKSLNLARV